MSSTYPLSRVRQQFPALRTGSALFDAPGGTQTPTRVADAIRDAMVSPVSQRGRNNYSEQNADRIVRGARAAMGDLLNVDPRAVFFGRSATQITFDVARAVARRLGPGDEIVASRLDHDANVRPWVLAADLSGATLRWIDFDRETGDLTADDVRRVLSDRTRFVAVTAASNLYGTAPDIAAIAAAVHAVGAEIYVDAVAYTAHELVDAVALGADYIVCSPYKFCGPHIGVLGSSVEKLEALVPDKLRPSTMQVPERFELGTLPYELLAGVTETVEFLADVIPGDGTRRERLERSYEAVAKHEDALFERLIAGLAEIDGVERIGAPSTHVPTALFRIDGRTTAEVCAALGRADVAVMGGSFYAIEAEDWADLRDGAVRAGIAPYTSVEDVDRLLHAVRALTL
ncbi:cysteine desulfurase-like protein [Microbacterium saperdae]|uniref:Cysteine desulfurase family protein (TIGR01976 family) n=1 Tax=Microbacterium saperdae TaxID=69368 RepID=A0A543B9W9_9MICO|nr:cysteine desulfurase-like protein [Microbacterium saperdae]TQL81592.1 cysteine desulfurase family protein (TIGR01976 family) [Microbacterium saperdae]